MQKTKLTIIIVNYNTQHLLSRCLDAVADNLKQISGKIIVVDNCSKDDSINYIRQHFNDVQLITNDKNIGFGRANNQAIDEIEGEYVLLLNTDAFLSANTISDTILYMDANPKIGILGVRLTGQDGELQPSCRYFPTLSNIFLIKTGLNKLFTQVQLVDNKNWDAAQTQECDWVPGCYYLVRKSVIDQIGLFDPRYFMYYEEVDHCLRAKNAGWKVLYYADTAVIHLGGESAKSEGSLTSGKQLNALQTESELLFFRKNHGIIKLLLHICLCVLADLYQALKNLLQFRFASIKNIAKNNVLLLKLIIKTHFGQQPTR